MTTRNRNILLTTLFGVALAAAVLVVVVSSSGRPSESRETGGPVTAVPTTGAPAADAAARRAFEAEGDAIPATGAPVALADLVGAQQAVDQSDNAAVPLGDASEITFDDLPDEFNDLALSRALTPEEWSVVDEALARAAPVMEFVDRAETLKHVDWPV